MTNIKQHTLQSRERILLVSVPSNSHHHYIHRNNLLFDVNDEQECGIVRNLPQGNWQLIGLSDEITEDQAKEFMPWLQIANDIGYFDYSKDYISYGCKTPLESLQSLLKSLGCEGRHAILKEVK